MQNICKLASDSFKQQCIQKQKQFFKYMLSYLAPDNFKQQCIKNRNNFLNICCRSIYNSLKINFITNLHKQQEVILAKVVQLVASLVICFYGRLFWMKLSSNKMIIL
eukprot:TRINITY_DN1285_c0_g1_i4.p5 TRINITY_DN1285_c0_g1~~TRINITY_DN1285_c0_g1_i4.p5  ORF type:complete len:107 (+),score=1.32 TRINITY_DN1285_c0_g1_i4:556-876(+)